MVWLFITAVLVLSSRYYKNSSDAIVAQVEPQKVAISYQKSVKLIRLFVIPGQDISIGDTLLIAERPDLVYDMEKSRNQLEAKLIERQKIYDDYNNRLLSNEISGRTRLSDLDHEIILINNRISTNKKLIHDMGTVQVDHEPIGDSTLTRDEIRLQALKNERIHTEKDYQLRQNKIAQERNTAIELINKEINILEQEIILFEKEKDELIKISPINGTVGNVYAQIDELVSPYTTIISLYKSNNNIIKAFTNERKRMEVTAGDTVLVESSNREYSIRGVVIEVGSRITDYPRRLLDNTLVDVFGQEIFISIPDDNRFLSGEKVYVSRVKKQRSN
jgi:multidrug resistance efflux pump